MEKHQGFKFIARTRREMPGYELVKIDPDGGVELSENIPDGIELAREIAHAMGADFQAQLGIEKIDKEGAFDVLRNL